MVHWVSGLNQRFAKPPPPRGPQVRILYAPPIKMKTLVRVKPLHLLIRDNDVKYRQVVINNFAGRIYRFHSISANGLPILMRVGEVVTHLVHTQEIVGSIPTPATNLSLRKRLSSFLV